MSKIEDQVERAARQISTENYDMSVGEVINMYDQLEININPEFQRLFRWDITQKSRFVESLLLRIPIPPIFVFEREDATWELIDGLQRVSTILEFVGTLRDADSGHTLPPSTLEGTRYLSALEGIKWEKQTESDKALPKSLQISIKRTRLSVQILERKSDKSSKYDLFQRLNSGGSVATRQEIRNCYMEMIDPDFRKFVVDLSQDENFQKIVQRSARQSERQANMELATRFLVYMLVPFNPKWDVEDYLDEGIIQLASDEKLNRADATKIFKKTFRLLFESLGENALKRFDGEKFKGKVGRAAFEVAAVGIATNLSKIEKKNDPHKYIADRVKEMWRQNEIDSFQKPGLRGTQRISQTIPFGIKWFK